MPKKVSETGLLVVVELGAEWPGLMRADASARRVLTQEDDETPAAFAERVTGTLDRLFGRGIKLTTVALACNERLDESATLARRRLCSLTLGSMAGSKRGKLYLTASARGSGRLHHALSGLAHDLSEEWRSAGLEVTVEFGEESRSSVTAAPAPAVRVA
ncbi:MAG TPA: hypothetical protein VJN18_22545 [Polyangiaceae bacterium]|nr:hypothetical protein [Polyangiaceae bacterium]